MNDFTDGLLGSSDDNPYLPGEFFEAYRSFHVIPSSHRQTYLLHLLGMKPHLIAPFRGNDEELVKEQLAETKAILLNRIERMVEIELDRMCDDELPTTESEKIGNPIRQLISLIPPATLPIYRLARKHGSVQKAAEELGISWTEAMDRIEPLKPLFRRHIESMMRCLLKIDASSPPPLNELAGMVAEAKSLRNFIVDYDEELKSEAAPLRSAPEMTHAESTEADRVLFDLPLPIREVFALHHCAELDDREIANILRISDSEVERYWALARAILYQRMEGLLVGFLQWKAATPDERRSEEFRMSKSERNTARSTWRLLPEECRTLVKGYLFQGLSVQEIAEITGLDVEFVDNLIEFTQEQLVLRMEALLTAWLRSNLPPKATTETILKKLQKDSFIEEELELAPKRRIPISEPEILVAETTLDEMEVLESKMFELFAVECDFDKIASIIDCEVKEVRKNLRSARQQLGDRLERLVIALTQRRIRQFHAPKLDGDEKAATEVVFKAIPKSCQKPFVLYMATGFSVEEIAETLDLLPYQVRHLISKAKKVIRNRAILAAIDWVRQGEDIETARDRVVGFHGTVSLLHGGLEEIEPKEEQPELEPPEKLTESEQEEMARALSQLSTDQLDAFVLYKALDWEANKAGRFLGTSGMEVEDQVRAARSVLSERLNALITTRLKREDNLPSAPRLTDSEAETARIAFEFIPESSREVYKRNVLTGESDEEIAEALGLTAETVVNLIRSSKGLIALRSEILAVSWLRERENGEPRWKRFLREIKIRVALAPKKARDEQTDFFYIKAELEEIETAIARLDFEIREAFVLGFGVGLGTPDIAAIQGTDEKETFRRLDEGIESIRGHIERLVVAWRRKRMKYQNAPRLKSTEGLTAKQFYIEIPEECREAFVRFRVKGELIQEIAAAFQVDTGKAEDWLKKAEEAITNRAVQLAAQVLDQVRDGRRVGEILLGDPKQIRFPASVWDEPDEMPQEEIPVEMEVSKKLSLVDLPHAVEVSEQSLEPAKPKRRNPLRTVLASVGLLFSQLGAATPSTGKVAAGIAVPTLATLTAPFLWVMSLLISGQVYGLAFVRTAPTLEARRWLVKQLFYGYSIIFVAPLAIITLIANLGFEDSRIWKTLINIALIILGFTVFIFIYRTSCRYNKMCFQGEPIQIKASSFLYTKNTINVGFIIGSMIILLFVVTYAQNRILFGNDNFVSFFRIFSLANIFGIIHVCSYILFRYLCGISKDENSFQENPPVYIAKNESLASIRILEFLRICPFALFPVFTGIRHLLIKNTHPLCTAIEIIGFTTIWMLIWYWNMKDGKRQWVRILVFFAMQIALMAYMRSFYYNTF